MQPHKRLCVLVAGWVIGLLLISQFVSSTQAQTTNITESVGTHLERSGNTTNIFMNIETPRRSGPNVLLSFGRFDLGAGDIANFVRPDTAATTVISRVTGGVSSNINGTIQAGGWTNFYFINPSGVILGPSAILSVPQGSVYISTADYIRFSDGNLIFVSPPTTGSITSAGVSAFGFTSSTVAPITISGNQLSVATGKTLAVIGGPITIDGAKLTAPNGKVQVASVGSTPGFGGEVTADSLEFIDNDGTLVPGSITMSPGSSFAALDASPAGVVVTNPGPDSIQNPAGSQKIVQPNLVTILPAGSTGTVGLSSAVQYPRVLAIPQLTIAAPRLVADKCAGTKDGQFSSFAQVNRDSAPPQPGRYLSSPTILDEALLRAGQASIPGPSIAMGASQLLHVAPELLTFLATNEGCAR